ncbi:hypothetical protein LEP1GSC112_0291, partial [Leptospira interrogans serovar Pomona str. UT364]
TGSDKNSQMCHRENYWIETITYGDEAGIKWGSVAPSATR